MKQQAIITVKDLYTYFYSNKRCNKVLNGISFELYKGRTLCIVGESGCGKSVTASCIMQLLPELSRIESGSITYHSDEGDIRIDQLERNGKKMRSLRGHDMAMIFQDPMTALNPVYTIGFQIGENLRYHTNLDKKQRRSKSLELLTHMGISTPEKRIDQYPHEFSGGMRQRAALLRTYLSSNGVALLDEPFSALDTITKSNIHKWYLNIMTHIDLSTLFITHDIDEAILLSDRIYILNGTPGEIRDEIVIHEQKPRPDDFYLTETFLNYKRDIISRL